MIWIRLHFDEVTSRDFRGIYLNGKLVDASWTLDEALAFADGLAAETGARIYSAPVVPFAKRGAA